MDPDIYPDLTGETFRKLPLNAVPAWVQCKIPRPTLNEMSDLNIPRLPMLTQFVLLKTILLPIRKSKSNPKSICLPQPYLLSFKLHAPLVSGRKLPF